MQEAVAAVPQDQGALAGLRVLELADLKGQYCGKLLADLGAEVIKVEPPEGDSARRRGPFKDDIPHPEGSLFFEYYNTNKKGLTLNLRRADGRELCRRLVSRSDVAIESFPPGTLEELSPRRLASGEGLDYETLKALNPALVLASITPFGQRGPYKDYQADPLVAFAMGGLMYISGSPERAPVAAPGVQAYDIASIHAALSILVALHHRRASGLGQYIEVSAQECLALEEHLISRYSLDGHIVRREGSQHGTTAPSRVYPCADGYIYLSSGGRLGSQSWGAFWEMMGKPEALADPVWEDQVFRRANVDVLNPFIVEFTTKHTKEELARWAQERHLPASPVNTPAQFLESPHTRARGYLVQVEHPQLGVHPFPGAPYRLSETPWWVRRPAPTLGQHNPEIYCGELGLSRGELAALFQSGVI